MKSIAAGFLTRCFAPGETIAVLLRRENPVSAAQRVVRLEQALAPRYLGWLAHENSTGANVYVAANPLHFGSRKRTKESIASVRYLYIDIDTDGEARSSLRSELRMLYPRRLRSCPRLPASIKRFGAWMASTLSIRKARSNFSPLRSAAIPPAPIATGCFASPAS
jgi:hypothetical protein